MDRHSVIIMYVKLATISVYVCVLEGIGVVGRGWERGRGGRRMGSSWCVSRRAGRTEACCCKHTALSCKQGATTPLSGPAQPNLPMHMPHGLPTLHPAPTPLPLNRFPPLTGLSVAHQHQQLAPLLGQKHARHLHQQHQGVAGVSGDCGQFQASMATKPRNGTHRWQGIRLGCLP